MVRPYVRLEYRKRRLLAVHTLFEDGLERKLRQATAVWTAVIHLSAK